MLKFSVLSFHLILLGAMEKQKFVYILNRDAQARLTISSPLEAHKAHNIVYHCVGIDVGFENPMFACLEVGKKYPFTIITLSYSYSIKLYVKIVEESVLTL